MKNLVHPETQRHRERALIFLRLGVIFRLFLNTVQLSIFLFPLCPLYLCGLLKKELYT